MVRSQRLALHKAVSLFSGASGSCLGLEMANFEILWANEFIPQAAMTYAINHPSVPLCRKDVREVTPAEILEACDLRVGELDLLEGSPPCASF